MAVRSGAMAVTCTDIFKLILAVIFPPLGVFVERGCGVDLLINIALTILGFIPGNFGGERLTFE